MSLLDAIRYHKAAQSWFSTCHVPPTNPSRSCWIVRTLYFSLEYKAPQATTISINIHCDRTASRPQVTLESEEFGSYNFRQWASSLNFGRCNQGCETEPGNFFLDPARVKEQINKYKIYLYLLGTWGEVSSAAVGSITESSVASRGLWIFDCCICWTVVTDGC